MIKDNRKMKNNLGTDITQQKWSEQLVRLNGEIATLLETNNYRTIMQFLDKIGIFKSPDTVIRNLMINVPKGADGEGNIDLKDKIGFMKVQSMIATMVGICMDNIEGENRLQGIERDDIISECMLSALDIPTMTHEELYRHTFAVIMQHILQHNHDAVMARQQYEEKLKVKELKAKKTEDAEIESMSDKIGNIKREIESVRISLDDLIEENDSIREMNLAIQEQKKHINIMKENPVPDSRLTTLEVNAQWSIRTLELRVAQKELERIPHFEEMIKSIKLAISNNTPGAKELLAQYEKKLEELNIKKKNLYRDFQGRLKDLGEEEYILQNLESIPINDKITQQIKEKHQELQRMLEEEGDLEKKLSDLIRKSESTNESPKFRQQRKREIYHELNHSNPRLEAIYKYRDELKGIRNLDKEQLSYSDGYEEDVYSDIGQDSTTDQADSPDDSFRYIFEGTSSRPDELLESEEFKVYLINTMKKFVSGRYPERDFSIIRDFYFSRDRAETIGGRYKHLGLRYGLSHTHIKNTIEKFNRKRNRQGMNRRLGEIV